MDKHRKDAIMAVVPGAPTHGVDDEAYEESKFGEFGEYMRRKKRKLQIEDARLRQAVPDKPQIFAGTVVHVANYTHPPIEELRRLLVLHGAIFIKYLDFKTMATHIVAMSLPPKKAHDWRRLRIVRPAWVVDSVAAGRQLPWHEYRLLGEGPQQKRLGFDSEGGQLSLRAGLPDQNQGYRAQSEHRAEDAEDRAKNDAPGHDVDRPQDTALAQTSEEHNAQLLADPATRAASAAHPGFLKTFFSESRLHHLSTWKAERKAWLQQRMAERTPQVPTTRPSGGRRFILHVDFDCFFCAVSLQRAIAGSVDNTGNAPRADLPAVVAHAASSNGSSEIASCNYPARALGVRNGMWMRQALALCPTLQLLSYDFAAYEAASEQLYEALLAMGGVVQSVSVDEALVDVTDVVGASDVDGERTADQLATALRADVFSRTGCHVSVGIGSNVLLAKVALRRAKPAGQFQVRPTEALDVLADLDVKQLPGVAGSTGAKLAALGVHTVRALRALSQERLANALGPKTGARLWAYARGEDDTTVDAGSGLRASVSAEVNWGIRFINQDEADAFVRDLCAELASRLRHEHVRGRRLTLKILRRAADAPLDPSKHLGHGRCDVLRKTVALGVATQDPEPLGRAAVALLRALCIRPGDLRGIGVQLQQLEEAVSEAASQRRLSFAAQNVDEKQVVNELPGTQFVMPPGVDPRVLSELPSDIVRRMRPDCRSTPDSVLIGRPADLPTDLPANVPADVDPNVFHALPANVRAEIVASYRHTTRSPSPRKTSPRRTPRPSPHKGPPNTGLGDFWGAWGLTTVDTASELKHEDDDSDDGDDDGESLEELDPEVLAALPADVRQEVLEDRRRQQQERLDRRAAQRLDVRQSDTIKTGGPEGPGPGPGSGPGREPDEGPERTPSPQPPQPPPAMLHFPPPPRKVPFRDSDDGAPMILEFSEIKSMIQAWHVATRTEGPHEADVRMLERYVAGLVTEERDMDKARRVVVWLAWLVEEGTETGTRAWQLAVRRIKEAIQAVMTARGLGPMSFG